MPDLILSNAALPDGRTGIDVAVENGRIVGIGAGIAAESSGAGEVIDAGGRLVSPPFVDPHFHMDATLSLGLPRINQSGTLLEGIALWGELKPILTVEAMVERALRYCDLAVARGLLFIRSHVDVSDPTLRTAEAMIAVRERVKPHIDLQLVAFPQDGYFRSAGAVELLARSLDMGLDIVGGIPHFERTMAEGAASLEALCRLAAERGLPVDIHCDETDDPLSRHVETLAAETLRFGLKGRVAASHCTSMHSMDNYYASKLIPLIAEAELDVIPNPLINITLQGRHDTYPRRRGLTRVAELRAAGVNVSFGHDCVMDPWYPLGSGDMLEVAHMAAHALPLTSREGLRWLFDAVTVNGAKTMRLDGYGLAVGARADFVLLQAADPIEALRLKAHRLLVVRNGRVVSRAGPKLFQLDLPGRPGTVDEAAYAPKAAG